MSFLSSERGVSEVLGAILVFALVLAVLVIIQVAGVPAANQQIEFEHNARVQEDFQAFDSAVDQAAVTGGSSSVAIESGVRYPPRLFLINPGPAAGTVTTGPATPVNISYVEAVNAETGEYLNGTWLGATTTLTYTPNYNEYQGAPSTRYENGIIYNVDDGGSAVTDRGNIISGNRISLTLLEGNISESSTRSTPLNLVPVNTPAQRVPITGNGSDIIITLDTNLSEEVWNEDILKNELKPTGNVLSAVCTSGAPVNEPCDGNMVITLDGTKVYELRLSKVGIGSGFKTDGPAYLTKIGADRPSLQPGGTDITVELRSKYSTPIAGENVSFNITSGAATFVGETTQKTDQYGRATITVNPQNNTSVSVKAYYDPNGDGKLTGGENVPEFVVTYEDLAVTDISAESTGDLKNINSREEDIVLGDVTLGTHPDGGNGRDRLTVEFKNTDTVSEWRLVEGRISFVLATGDPSSAELAVVDGGNTIPVETLGTTGDFVLFDTNPVVIGPNDTVELQFDFNANLEDSLGGPGTFDSLVVVTFKAESTNPDETVYLTYFITD